ncbi:hypothetical protein LSTR_LSTR002101 [Laodelphax striatellus]|uniref:CSD domain-containing protein n=1 Tax=Laodelphax striatellus TaxID=195883 RepID=A0A482XPG6_LAOST|nr:hypothetical protein LSTR_LSTR002101 [Laodelphax striatellus]
MKNVFKLKNVSRISLDKHGDWVQFFIATDRRDQLQRASSIALLPESFLVSGERREQGIIASKKDGYGFLKCVEREPKIFFRYCEVLDVDREINVNDEVEFTVVQDSTLSFNAYSRQSAIRIQHLPPGTVQFEIVQERNVTGVVSKEAPNSWLPRSPTKIISNNQNQECGTISYQINGIKKTINYYAKDCDPKCAPHVGDKVEFSVCQVKRNKEIIALDIIILKSQNQHFNSTKNGITNQPVCQGFIAALKDGFGFIEAMSHNREVFFRFCNYEGDSDTLELGMEVEYVVGGKASSGSCISAEMVRTLPAGTINLGVTIGDDILEGKVVRPLRSVNPDQNEYAGLIKTNAEDENGAEYEFGITSLANKRELLQVKDSVQFQVDSNGRAANVVAIRKKRKATVDAIKGAFGFLAYEVDDGKKLFYHTSEVKDGVQLQQGDTVEFVLMYNHRTGKSSACNVTKVSPEKEQRPERLVSRLRTISLEDGGPKLTVARQPRGPDGTKGFATDMRMPRIAGVLVE